MQWFYFRVDGAVGVDYTLRILNAGDASYPNGWLNYRVCTSSDRRTWTRLILTSPTVSPSNTSAIGATVVCLLCALYLRPASRLFGTLPFPHRDRLERHSMIATFIDCAREGLLQFWLIGRRIQASMASGGWMVF